MLSCKDQLLSFATRQTCPSFAAIRLRPTTVKYAYKRLYIFMSSPPFPLYLICKKHAHTPFFILINMSSSSSTPQDVRQCISYLLNSDMCNSKAPAQKDHLKRPSSLSLEDRKLAEDVVKDSMHPRDKMLYHTLALSKQMDASGTLSEQFCPIIIQPPFLSAWVQTRHHLLSL